MPDKEALLERLAEIRKRRSFLEDYVGETFEEFSQDRGHYTIALHDLQVGVQACLDIASHIVAAESFENPKEIKNVFLVLAQMGLIEKNLAERLVQAGAVRNILVHSYLDVDLHIIYGILQNHLTDFDRFAAAIDDYLKKISA